MRSTAFLQLLHIGRGKLGSAVELRGVGMSLGVLSSGNTGLGH